MQFQVLKAQFTLIPSNLDRARRGLSALRVLRDLIGPRSEYPSQLATKLTREICQNIFLFIQLADFKHVYLASKFNIQTYIYNKKIEPTPSIGEVGLESVCNPFEEHLNNKDVSEDLVSKLQNGFDGPASFYVDVFKGLWKHLSRCLITINER